MKGAFLLADDPRFFEKAKDLLVSKGALFVAEDGVVQIGGSNDDVFTLYNSAEPEWEFRRGPFRAEPGAGVPNMSVVSGFAIECNSEEYFVRVVGEIARVSERSTWVLDGDGVIWEAGKIDATRITL